MKVFSAKKFLETEGIKVYASELVNTKGDWLLNLVGCVYSEVENAVIGRDGLKHGVKQEWLLEVDTDADLDIVYRFSPWIYKHTQGEKDYLYNVEEPWFKACVGMVSDSKDFITGDDKCGYFNDIEWCEILLKVEL